MTSVEGLAYDTLSKNILKPIGEITDALPYSRSKVSRILKDLIAKNLVVKVGNGRGTRYKKRT
jgi:ATP-dependent DNA helicase RecG